MLHHFGDTAETRSEESVLGSFPTAGVDITQESLVRSTKLKKDESV